MQLLHSRPCSGLVRHFWRSESINPLKIKVLCPTETRNWGKQGLQLQRLYEGTSRGSFQVFSFLAARDGSSGIGLPRSEGISLNNCLRASTSWLEKSIEVWWFDPINSDLVEQTHSRAFAESNTWWILMGYFALLDAGKACDCQRQWNQAASFRRYPRTYSRGPLQ